MNIFSTQNLLAIAGILCLFASAMSFSSNSISLMVSKEWYYKGRPKKLNHFLGLLVGIRNREDALNLFEGGTYEEIEKRTDSQSHVRGFVWLIVGSVLGVVVLLI